MKLYIIYYVAVKTITEKLNNIISTNDDYLNHVISLKKKKKTVNILNYRANPTFVGYYC